MFSLQHGGVIGVAFIVLQPRQPRVLAQRVHQIRLCDQLLLQLQIGHQRIVDIRKCIAD